ESLGMRLGRTTVGWHLRRIHKRRGERTLLSRYGSEAAKLLWLEAQQLNDAFFDGLQERLQRSGSAGDGHALHDEAVEEGLSPILRALSGELSSAAMRTEQVDAQMELQARANGLDGLCQMLKALCVPNPEAETPLVRWIEPSRHGAQLCGAPLDVSAALRRHLFEGGATAVLTSATLATGDDDQFSWLRNQIGLDQANTLRVGSPFDYDRSVDFVIEEAMPDPARESHSYRREVAERTLRHVLDNGGRALILCTSWDFVRHLAQQLRPALNGAGIELLVQGEQPLARLLEQKRDDQTSVLIGTDSLWEGIDVRGDALTLLVVTRLPFASPGHPLTQARMDLMKQRGKDPFAEHSLPEAILKFRQGFGRLIRGQRDRGKVVLMDPRVRTKGYGRRFVSALPFSDDYPGHQGAI
ncbi:MAG: hypothetical protein KAI24_21500, partial [Planctomycetes bacterium]|nr:hypothetical protein [Planctomycetota bacterium]